MHEQLPLLVELMLCADFFADPYGRDADTGRDEGAHGISNASIGRGSIDLRELGGGKGRKIKFATTSLSTNDSIEAIMTTLRHNACCCCCCYGGTRAECRVS